MNLNLSLDDMVRLASLGVHLRSLFSKFSISSPENEKKIESLVKRILSQYRDGKLDGILTAFEQYAEALKSETPKFHEMCVCVCGHFRKYHTVAGWSCSAMGCSCREFYVKAPAPLQTP